MRTLSTEPGAVQADAHRRAAHEILGEPPARLPATSPLSRQAQEGQLRCVKRRHRDWLRARPADESVGITKENGMGAG
jgi:hypothetical protein